MRALSVLPPAPKQRLYGYRVIARFAIPARRRCVAVDVQPLFFVLLDQLVPVYQRPRVIRRCAIEGSPVRGHKTNSAIIEH